MTLNNKLPINLFLGNKFNSSLFSSHALPQMNLSLLCAYLSTLILHPALLHPLPHPPSIRSTHTNTHLPTHLLRPHLLAHAHYQKYPLADTLTTQACLKPPHGLDSNCKSTINQQTTGFQYASVSTLSAHITACTCKYTSRPHTQQGQQ